MSLFQTSSVLGKDWEGGSHVRQNRLRCRRPKVRPEGLRKCLEDAGKVLGEEQQDTMSCRKEKVFSLLHATHVPIRTWAIQKPVCDYNHRSVSLLRGRRP